MLWSLSGCGYGHVVDGEFALSAGSVLKFQPCSEGAEVYTVAVFSSSRASCAHQATLPVVERFYVRVWYDLLGVQQ